MTVKDYQEDPIGNYVKKIAQAESGNRPGVKNPYGSATGLYQFTEDTWNNMSNKYKLNYTLNDRKDPRKSEIVMRLFTQDNEKIIKPVLGRELTDGDRYMTHFLGAGGATKFFREYAKNPNAPVNTVMSPKAIADNRHVTINKDGSLKKLSDVYDWANRHMNIKTPNVNYTTTEYQSEQTITPYTTDFEVTKLDAGVNLKEQEKQQAKEELTAINNEKQLIEDIANNRLEIPQEKEEQQKYQQPQVQEPTLAESYAQISQFVDTPIAQQGGRIINVNGKPMNTDSQEYRELYKNGQIQNSKANGEDIPYFGGELNEVVVKQTPREKGFWEQSRDQYLEENKDTGLLGAIASVATYPMGVPQQAMMYATTGKVQKPSEGIGVENKYGAIATDMILDPTNLVGAGILTKEKALSAIARGTEKKFLQNSVSKLKNQITKENFNNILNEKFIPTFQKNLPDNVHLDEIGDAVVLKGNNKTLGSLHINKQDNFAYPGFISVDKKLWGNRTQDLLYDAAIEKLKKEGYDGIRSGDHLISPAKTEKAHRRFETVGTGHFGIGGVEIKTLTSHKNPNLQKEWFENYQNIPKNFEKASINDVGQFVGKNKREMGLLSIGAGTTVALQDLIGNQMFDPDYESKIMKWAKEFDKKEELPQKKDGGYVVTRSSDRKGKTHKVTSPDGTFKYFGDSNLGQHPKDPKRKAAFYARHKENLKNNPFFRAFARKTWQEGGEIDYEDIFQQGGLQNYFNVIEDQQGQRRFPNQITRINGDTMATDGYGNIPLYVVPNVGKPRIIFPNTGEHTFKGAKYFTEYPIKK